MTPAEVNTPHRRRTRLGRSTDAGSTTTGRPLRTALVDIARSHLTLLTLVELAAFVAALLLGWKEVAVAVLWWHVLRMAVAAVRGQREVRDEG
jgi:hypothetical protein